MTGPEKIGGAGAACFAAQSLVAGNGDAGADFGDRAGLGCVPGGTDQQPGIASQHRACVHFFRQPTGDGGSADVMGDVRVQFFGPEPVHGPGDGVAGAAWFALKAGLQPWGRFATLGPKFRGGAFRP